jgi:hypothetical protein
MSRTISAALLLGIGVLGLATCNGRRSSAHLGVNLVLEHCPLIETWRASPLQATADGGTIYVSVTAARSSQDNDAGTVSSAGTGGDAAADGGAEARVDGGTDAGADAGADARADGGADGGGDGGGNDGAGVDADGGADGAASGLEYQWSADAGVFEDPTAPTTVYTCGAPGIQTLTITVTDTMLSVPCADEVGLTVKCVAAKP